jgi:hypothetical protein
MVNFDKDILEYIRNNYVAKGSRFYGLYIDDNNAKFFDDVVRKIEKLNGCYNYALGYRRVTRKKCLDTELLYNDIDTAIEYLKTIKSEGYTSIDDEWDSYESYDIYAYKESVETIEEAAERIFKEYIYPKVCDMEKNEDEVLKKKAEIKRLQAEIDKLKG